MVQRSVSDCMRSKIWNFQIRSKIFFLGETFEFLLNIFVHLYIRDIRIYACLYEIVILTSSYLRLRLYYPNMFLKSLKENGVYGYSVFARLSFFKRKKKLTPWPIFYINVGIYAEIAPLPQTSEYANGVETVRYNIAYGRVVYNIARQQLNFIVENNNIIFTKRFMSHSKFSTHFGSNARKSNFIKLLIEMIGSVHYDQ